MSEFFGESIDSHGSFSFLGQTKVTGGDLNQVLFDKTQLIDKMKNDPTFLPTYQQVLDTIRNKEREGYDLKVLGDIYPNQNEIMTKELIHKLADIIETSLIILSKQYENITILEVGAGRGALSFALNNELKSRGCEKYTILATDKEDEELSLYPIEKIPYDKAIDKYKPHIILSSRMPQIYVRDASQSFSNLTEQDTHRAWTYKFCNNINTQFYILLGIPGMCGDKQFIWGSGLNGEEIQSCALGASFQLVPYIKNGFKRFSDITPRVNIYNNGYKTGDSGRSAETFSMVSKYKRENPNETNHRSSLTSAFIKNTDIIEELKKKKIL